MYGIKISHVVMAYPIRKATVDIGEVLTNKIASIILELDNDIDRQCCRLLLCLLRWWPFGPSSHLLNQLQCMASDARSIMDFARSSHSL